MISRPATKLAARLRCLRCIFIVLFTITISEAQPTKVSACQLKNDPAAYNHKLVEVTGFVTHAARNFTIYDPTCPTWPAIWLEYGGSINSGTVACCKTLADRQRRQPLQIESIPLPLMDNQLFQDFDRAIQPPFPEGQGSAVEHATIIGTFFAGQQMQTAAGQPYWGGFGYLGCCSLLAIQEIKDADIQRRDDLDYGESTEKLSLPDPDCTLRTLLPDEQTAAFLNAQRNADSASQDWAFSDPARVASETLSRVGHLKSVTAAGLKLLHDTPARKTYQWTAGHRPKTYTIILSRPYWLSFYARDPHRVAWMPVAAYETSCDTPAE
jgi:hypothetical protein